MLLELAPRSDFNQMGSLMDNLFESDRTASDMLLTCSAAVQPQKKCYLFQSI